MTLLERGVDPAKQADEEALIEEARRLRRRRWLFGAAVTALAIGVSLIVGFGGGSGGGTSRGGHDTSRNAPGPGGSSAHQTNARFLGAPVSQHVDGTQSWVCPLAPPNRYLPARSGCVTVIRADMTGAGRPDLVIIYSHLNHTSGYYPGGPSTWEHYFRASDATIELVRPDGKRVSSRLETYFRGRAYPVHAAAIIAVKNVNDDPGDELFLAIGGTSSGSDAIAYGYRHGRLIPAGVVLSYGGDSNVQAGFNCLPGHPARLIQRVYVPGGNLLTAPWRETDTMYIWHGARLVEAARRTYRRPPVARSKELNVGAACGALHGLSAAPPS